MDESPLCAQADYGYTARDGACQASNCAGSTYKVKSYVDVTASSTDSLFNALQNGPVAVAVDASNWSSYKSGVFSNCGQSLNHGVLLVGFNNIDQSWIVKNSWGTRYGQAGYIYLAAGNTCGIANVANYPVV